MGSPVFGDPDAMINTRTVEKEMFDSYEKVSIALPDGSIEEVMLDSTWGPLILQENGNAVFPTFSRNHAPWRMRTNTDQNARIHVAAKQNKRTKERILEKMLEQGGA